MHYVNDSAHTSGCTLGKECRCIPSISLPLPHLQGKVVSTFDPASHDSAPSCQPGGLLVKAAWELAQKAHFPVVMAGVGEQDAVARILSGVQEG